MLVHRTEELESYKSASLDVVNELYGEIGMAEHRFSNPTDAALENELLDRITNHCGGYGHIALIGDNPDIPVEQYDDYMRLCRIEAAKRFFGPEYSKADAATRRGFVTDDRLLLVATVDIDDKGNASSPDSHWRERVKRIGCCTVPVISLPGMERPAVDLVVVEGGGRQAGSALESHLAFGSALRDLGALDTWLVLGNDTQTLLEARNIAAGSSTEVVALG